MTDAEIIQSIKRRIKELEGKKDKASKLVLLTLKEDLYRREHPQPRPKIADSYMEEDEILAKIPKGIIYNNERQMSIGFG